MKTALSLLFLSLVCMGHLFAQNSTPPASTTDEEIFAKADEAPMFPGCEGKRSKSQVEDCASSTLLSKFYTNLNYPAEARQQNIQGTVIATFVVEKDGRISNAKIKTGIGGGCDEEVLRAVNAMNDLGVVWKPGKKGGQPVRTWAEIPVNFTLQE